MATKKEKYESMRIMSLEGSVLYKNEGFSATKNGKPDPGAFRGVLDESLDTLKLAEVYDQHKSEIGYPYLDGKKRFCRAVVNLSFNRAVKVPAVSNLTVGFFYCYPTDDIIGEKDKSRR